MSDSAARGAARVVAWGLALLLPLLPAAAAPARELDAATVTFVLGNVEFVVLHEFAHLILGEYEVPVFGPEETAADHLAAIALLRQRQRDPARAERAVEFLVVTAEAFRLAWEKGSALGADVPYWGAHALNIQRFYQIGCLLYGSDPDRFADLPDRLGLPMARAGGCRAEFERADRAVQWLLRTYGRRADAARVENIEISYGEAPTLISRQLAAAMREEGLLENLAQRIDAAFALPRPVRLVVQSCRRSEAAWQPERAELLVCYELFDTFYRLSQQRERRD